MATTLFDISAASYLQVLGAVSAFLEKGKSYCDENKIELDEVVETRLYPDMLPFRFQVTSVAHHSLGTMKALDSGVFSPSGGFPDFDYAGLQGLIAETLDEMQRYTPEAVNALADNEVAFQMGDTRMPFTASDFVLSFSHFNLYFHATTAFDILRMKGVPIGKRDFMGMPRMKT